MASGGPRRPARSAALPGFALLAEATRALGTLDLGRLVNRLTELTRANLAADAAGVWLLERGGSELVLHSGAGFKHPEVVTRLTQAPGRDVLGWIVDRPGPVAVRDLRAAARPEVRRWIESEEFGAFLGVPLVGDATPLGMLGLFRRGRRIFTAADLALTRTLCLPAAPAIVNARLHAELAQQAAVATEQARQHGVSVRRAGELEALLRAVRTMLSGLDTKTILDSIVQEASAIAGTSQVALRLLDRASGSLRVAALAGSSIPSDVATPPGERHSAEVTRSGQLFADDTCLGLPVKIRGTVLGVLCFTTAAPRRYSAEELAHLGSFADHAAIALDNARLYEDAQGAISDLHVMQRRLVQGETLRALGELAGGAAHHLNNLLTIVVGRIQLLRRTVTEERLLRPLEIVERAAKDGAEVVRRLQQFAGMRRVSEPHSVDLNQIVMDVIEISRPQWQDPSRAEGTEIVVESRLAPLP